MVVLFSGKVWTSNRRPKQRAIELNSVMNKVAKLRVPNENVIKNQWEYLCTNCWRAV